MERQKQARLDLTVTSLQAHTETLPEGTRPTPAQHIRPVPPSSEGASPRLISHLPAPILTLLDSRKFHYRFFVTFDLDIGVRYQVYAIQDAVFSTKAYLSSFVLSFHSNKHCRWSKGLGRPRGS